MFEFVVGIIAVGIVLVFLLVLFVFTDRLKISKTRFVQPVRGTIQTCVILDSLMELAPVGMAFFDNEKRFILVNDWFAKISITKDYIGKSIDEIPNIAEIIKTKLHQIIIDNIPVSDNETHGCIDGRNFIWLVSYYPVYSSNGNRLCVGMVVKDITEQKVLENELRKRVQEVTDSDRQKTEFLAMLAHELRNPLAPIVNSVYMLDTLSEKTESNYEEKARAREIINRQIQHMGHLLDDLLDIAIINRGKIKLRKEAVDVNVMLTRCVDLYKSAAEVRHHNTLLKLSTQPLVVNADPTRLEQIFGNIYNNAIKYTEPGGCIEVSSEATDDWARVSIKDNGIGISTNVLPKLFEIFAQATRSLDRAEGGLGLGLALCQDLIRLHGGKIEANSAGLGKGSEFMMKLPLMQAHSYKIDTDTDTDTIPVCTKVLRILVVDDNRDAAESLALLINHNGHETQMVFDGATALKKVNVYNPDAIMLDIGLPGLDGFTCCELLRESHYNGLIVAVTGYGADSDRIRSKEAGFNHHLTKPVHPKELVRLLNNYANLTKEVA